MTLSYLAYLSAGRSVRAAWGVDLDHFKAEVVAFNSP
jgi:hypothetical protein